VKEELQKDIKHLTKIKQKLWKKKPLQQTRTSGRWNFRA
jgi:hypothetical protein